MNNSKMTKPIMNSTKMKTIAAVSILSIVCVGALGAYFWTDNSAMQGSSSSSAASNNMGSAADQNSDMAKFMAGGLQVAISTEPATPVVGENTLIVQLTDKDGNPLTDAELNAYAEMPAMGAMAAMRAPAGLKQTQPGRYEGMLDLSMRGEWPLTLRIAGTPEGDKRLQFDLATDRKGLEIAAGGVPMGGPNGAGGNNSAGANNSGADENTIMVDNRRRQMIGLETGLATHRDLVKTIRAVAQVQYDERLLSEVTLRFDGYIGKLMANYVGAKITQGQTLFTVYSPELLAAQQEYLETLSRSRRKSSQRAGQQKLLKAAKQRLQLWDMSVEAIADLERAGAPQDYVAFKAPRNGTLVERNISDGGAAKKGQSLLSIADLSQVWVEAEVFEADLQQVELGMSAQISFPYLPGRMYTATVEYIYPYLNAQSRTAKIRFTLENADGALKPEMYAEVKLQVELGHRLSVPEEAVLVSGQSRVVFVDLGQGQLKPVRVKTGRRAQGFVEINQGLSLGDKVVTSGNFLIASETRLKTGIEQW